MQAPAPGTAASCVLTTELEQGPFWLDDIMFRSNLTENQPGIPLLLRIKLVNSLTDCEPLVDAFVDVWSCNSTGFYSGFTSESAASFKWVALLSGDAVMQQCQEICAKQLQDTQDWLQSKHRVEHSDAHTSF